MCCAVKCCVVVNEIEGEEEEGGERGGGRGERKKERTKGDVRIYRHHNEGRESGNKFKHFALPQ